MQADLPNPVKMPDRRPFSETLAAAAEVAQIAIEAAVRRHQHHGPVTEAMLYAVGGGKGLRAFLVMESCRILDARVISASDAALAAGAIEALHAYSLIHDDLPCMDDDDLRRGLPTVHRKWDEATAVLAGDGLQALAFQMLAEVQAPAAAYRDLVLSFSMAVGLGGMVGGQALDIAAETSGDRLTLAQIIALQKGKTGALITWAATVGPRFGGADIAPLQSYGERLGLAFQIWDDVLDVEGDAATLGKAVGKDRAAGKATFVSHLGIDGAKGRAHMLVQEACEALSVYGENAETLRAAARFVIDRDK